MWILLLKPGWCCFTRLFIGWKSTIESSENPLEPITNNGKRVTLPADVDARSLTMITFVILIVVEGNRSWCRFVRVSPELERGISAMHKRRYIIIIITITI